MKNYIILLLLSFALVSCKTATAKPEKPIAVPVANAAFFREISKKPDFDQVKISSRVDVETGAFIPTLDATIYIEDGQKISSTLRRCKTFCSDVLSFLFRRKISVSVSPCRDTGLILKRTYASAAMATNLITL